ncbi:MAG: flagellar assembly protein FliW, partial [Actinomycetota bacterium]
MGAGDVDVVNVGAEDMGAEDMGASNVGTTDSSATMQEPEGVLRFDDGIPGFAQAHRFVLSDLSDDGTFQLMTCIEDPDLSLVVASPWLFFPDYAPELPEEDRSVLAIDDPTQAVLFSTVNLDDDERLVINLRAPFVANARTLAARQVILEEDHP